MEQKGFLKIIFLGTLFLILALVTLSVPSSKTNQQRQTPLPTLNKPVTGAQLKFSPSSLIKKSGDSFDVDIIIDTQDKKVTAADLTINLDPTRVKFTDVQAGDFFEKPVILNKEVDNIKGVLNLAVGGFSGKKGLGKIASLKLELKKISNIQPTIIKFNPKTAVAAVGEDKSVLISSEQLKITILP